MVIYKYIIRYLITSVTCCSNTYYLNIGSIHLKYYIFCSWATIRDYRFKAIILRERANGANIFANLILWYR